MNTKSAMVMALTGALVAGLAGCATEHDRMMSQGYPASYADGYDDGCHSGRKAGGSLFDQFKKDVNRFNSDTNYAQGWSDAFRQCESEQEAAQRQARMVIEQQKLKEAQKANQATRDRELLKGINTTGLNVLK